MSKEPIVVKVPFPFQDLIIFQKFIRELKTENRFILSSTTKQFIDGLIQYAKSHKTVNLNESTNFFRTRINKIQIDKKDDEKKPKSPEDMLAPPPEITAQGRINPKGIPYLYLASDENTAIAEVRPWVGEWISVAKISLNQKISIVNFTSGNLLADNSSNQEQTAADVTWDLFNFLFSRPVTEKDELEYLHTQYIAESIKTAEFHGIAYDSLLGSGYNLAIFDQSLVTVEEVYLSKLKKVKYEYMIKK